MYCYALLENDICVGISEQSHYVEAENYVDIESFNEDYIDRVYNRETQEWGEKIKRDIIIEDIPTSELLNASILLNQQEILINQRAQDETLAAILLAGVSDNV